MNEYNNYAENNFLEYFYLTGYYLIVIIDWFGQRIQYMNYYIKYYFMMY